MFLLFIPKFNLPISVGPKLLKLFVSLVKDVCSKSKGRGFESHPRTIMLENGITEKWETTEYTVQTQLGLRVKLIIYIIPRKI